MKYRLKNFYPVLPGNTLIEVLRTRNMTQAHLSRLMGRPLKLINEIVKGKASITPETAIQLGEALDMSIDFWWKLQTDYDMSVAYHAKNSKALLEPNL